MNSIPFSKIFLSLAFENVAKPYESSYSVIIETATVSFSEREKSFFFMASQCGEFESVR